MIKRVCKYILAFAILLAIAVVSASAMLVGWVMREPRNLPQLVPYIEDVLAAKEAGISTEIGEVWLTYGGWKHPLDLHLQKIRVTRDGVMITSFSEIALRPDLLSLPFGQILPAAITISNPTIYLYQNQDRSISFGFGEFDFSTPTDAENEKPRTMPSMIPITTLLTLISEDKSSLRKLRYFKIIDAKATIGNQRLGKIFEVSNVNINAKRNWERRCSRGTGRRHGIPETINRL
jgi:hypothetical protein